MLFNSTAFIFGFLPLALLGFFVCARWSHGLALAWLTAASLFFYAWWNVIWLPLMLASIAFNLMAARCIGASAQMTQPPFGLPARTLLISAIGVNIALLVHYKYSGFLLAQWQLLMHTPVPHSAPELPLGISFFTFTQIAFLVDVYQRKAADFNPLRFGLFVTYYPHLIAGPILHHRQMMSQFEQPRIFSFDATRLADGTTVFILGLFKKTVLADALARHASAGFEAATTQPLGFFEAWGAALAYTLQLYFDFSGYSDMAIGLALMIGITLPLNFHSPYQAHNIAEFWRRWHMSLSQFLRDYVYIPLGGNRRGPARRHVNVMLTMLLGGLWHGAGWSFVLWGALHGLYLMVHQLWRAALGRAPWPATVLPAVWRRGWHVLAWFITFLAVVVAWVFFRARDVPTALSMLAGMAGQHGSVLPEQWLVVAPWLRHVAHGLAKVPHLADGTVMGALELLVLLAIGMLIVRFAPAMHTLRPRTRLWLVVPCAALSFERVLLGTSSEFLYFQF